MQDLDGPHKQRSADELYAQGQNEFRMLRKLVCDKVSGYCGSSFRE